MKKKKKKKEIDLFITKYEKYENVSLSITAITDYQRFSGVISFLPFFRTLKNN